MFCLRNDWSVFLVLRHSFPIFVCHLQRTAYSLGRYRAYLAVEFSVGCGITAARLQYNSAEIAVQSCSGCGIRCVPLEYNLRTVKPQTI